MILTEIREKYNKGDYTYRKSDIPKKVPVDYVFDENLSVKRNRELVIEHNKRIDEMYAEAQKKQNMLHWQLTDDVINYIIENYNLNEIASALLQDVLYNIMKIATLKELA